METEDVFCTSIDVLRWTNHVKDVNKRGNFLQCIEDRNQTGTEDVDQQETEETDNDGIIEAESDHPYGWSFYGWLKPPSNETSYPMR